MTDNTYTTFKAWMLSEFTHNQLVDLSHHGAVSGFPGITYYSETIALYEQYHDDIWSALYEDCEEFGCANCLELIASFCGAKDVGNDAQLKNLLVWYLAEKIAFDVTQGEYLPDDEDDYVQNTNQ